MAFLKAVKRKHFLCSNSVLVHELYTFSYERTILRRYFITSSLASHNKDNVVKKDISGKLPRAHVPKDVESGWYEWWKMNGYFSPKSSPACSSRTFTMLLPPPNVTGTLHLGHALTVTVQDVVARWRRMRGENVVWIPGTDHAGIATQVVVEKKLWKEKKMTRHQIGRDRFLNEVLHWRKEKGSYIQDQLRRLGATLDWDREYFTMDEGLSVAVTEAFVRLFDAGLIYRSNMPVNWSCSLRSTISDVEVDKHEIQGPTAIPVPGYDKPVGFGTLTNIAYKLCDQEGELVVSTTRPETMLGDVAVAVHPNDQRYSRFRGSYVWHPYRKEKIPVIFDEFVDPDFGTGAVKITPAHSLTDFEVANRHKLEAVSVIDEAGFISVDIEQFKGKKRFDVRALLRDDLVSRNLFRGTHSHKMEIPICSRSGDVVEFILKPQWFMNTKTMAKRAADAVRQGVLQLHPKDMEKRWLTWFDDHRDWCLSRQLWWGHRIPAYECKLVSNNRTEWVAAVSEPEARSKAARLLGCSDATSDLVVKQDEDVLDTWFSSSILPFSVFGWPRQTEELQHLYPLSFMETGNDILFFWVARMVMMGLELTEQLPFKDVLLHGVICDALGRKMSKSIGNVVSPEDVIDGVPVEELIDRVVQGYRAGAFSESEMENARKGQMQLFPNGIPTCGTDALRFTLCSRNILNHFISFNVEECQMNKHMCNKLWQACRYIENVVQQKETRPSLNSIDYNALRTMDLWILSRLSALVMDLDEGLKKFDFISCTLAIRNFIFDDFCDVYLETTKEIFKDTDHLKKDITVSVLLTCVHTLLSALSPFMPFISEELFHYVPGRPANCDSIMLTRYPLPDQWVDWRNEVLEEDIRKALGVITAVRSLKNSNSIRYKDKVPVYIQIKSDSDVSWLQRHVQLVESMAGCSKIDISAVDHSVMSSKPTEQRLEDGMVVGVVLKVDHEKSMVMMAKKKAILTGLRKMPKLHKSISKLEKSISAPWFHTKTPVDAQEALTKKLAILKEELKNIEELVNEEPDISNPLKIQVEMELVEKQKTKQVPLLKKEERKGKEETGC